MNSILLAVALGAGALSNFPRDAGGRISQSGIGVSVGGAPAVVVAAGDRVVAYRADGTAPAGFPFSIGDGESAAGGPAAGDMDGDHSPEVAVVTLSGKLFVWSGRVLPGFPVSLGAQAKAGVSFVDVDGDGKPEAVVGDDRGRVHAFKKSGAEARGFPISVSSTPVTSTVSSSNFAGVAALAVGCEDGKVHVVDAGGRERPGFPLVTQFAVTAAPVFADLDDDGEMDLVVASQDFKLYAVNHKGELLPGFPVAAGYRIYDSPAVVDLDGDRRLHVIFASADGAVHAVDPQGRERAGFPVRAGLRIFGGPAVGDVDRDGIPDIVVVAADGSVFAFTAAGKPVAGFPSPVEGTDVGASPLLHDLTGDGTLSIFVGVPSGQLFAVRASRGGTAHGAAAWPGPAHDAGRTGRYGPNAPTYKDLKLAPAEPRVTDKLVASWRGVWLDAGPGTSVPAPRVEWLRNGHSVPGLESSKEVPPGTARRGERWRFVLTVPSGKAVAESAEVRVADSAPGAAEIALDPPVPTRAAPVKMVLRKPAADPDADPLTYRTEWLQDGLETGVKSDTFPGDRLRRGALLTARVYASDGELEGPPVSTSSRVADTAPGPLAISLEPAQAARTDAIRVRIERPASDLDGDRLVYHHRWTVDGQRRNLPLSTAELPAGLARKHQRVRAEVRAFDGELEGPPATAEVVLRNTPPTAPRVDVLPARPRRGEALRAVVSVPSQDADGDPVSYRFTWRKNGLPLPLLGDPREVPGREVAKGDQFEVTVVPGDGEEEGPRAQTLALVLNTPPSPPRIAVEPAHPRGGQPLKIVILEPPRDADGDPVRLSYAWTRESKATGKASETLAPADFHKHEHVRATVVPHDGDESGEAATFEVLVEDAPPTAPVVAFTTDHPTVTEPLRATIVKAATDPDGDPLRYRYRWLRNGEGVAVPDRNASSRVEPFWTSASEVPVTELAKRQAWEVEVQAWDGEMYGPSARASVTIANSPPPAPEIAFAAEKPRRVDGLEVVVKQPPDPDGDLVTYRYTWTRNGERYAAPPEQAYVARGLPRRGERWAVEVVASDGEAESRPVRLEAVIADTAPGPVGIALCDGAVPVGHMPQVRITAAASDADGDAVSYRYAWSVNGKPVAAEAGAKLAAPPLRKHDVARVVVTPFDGEKRGPPSSAECQVVNTPPTAPQVALEPPEPTAGTGLTVVVRRPSTDPDGDAVTYRYAWTRDGVPADVEGPSVPKNGLHHREVWRVEVTPWDGEQTGEPVVLSAVVRNTPPPAPEVAVTPAAPRVGASIACEAKAPARDVDQEPLSVRYRWLRDGKAVALAEGQPAVPSGVVRRGERWRCEAWTSDGFEESPRAFAEVEVKDSAPRPPVVVIEPDRPRKGDDLACRLAIESVDPDGDAVTYGYAWTRNERPVPPAADPAVVDGKRIAKEERWRCTVVPSDGLLEGTPASATVTVANSPPGPARLELQPAVPRPGHPVRCEVAVKSVDPDGDAVRYRFTWQRNGVPQPFAETSQEVPARLVKAGDRWRCVAVPSDGDLDGPETGSEEVQVSGAAEAALQER
ncbi:MAG TPA: hypothetical protein VLU43_19080 [Anaeromyxobacteraceae bacterium]|nr:hypothetical protein [Anaeromyxobacteraceae bacterium]